jgi:hypothetical protein
MSVDPDPRKKVFHVFIKKLVITLLVPKNKSNSNNFSKFTSKIDTSFTF